MYAWLTDALDGGGRVVTANRRLARVLRDSYATTRISAGDAAWRTPPIDSWQDWLSIVVDGSGLQDDLPVRITGQQSALIWDECLRREFDEHQSGLAALVRLSRDARQRLADWRIDVRTVARFASSEDERLYSSVLGRYLATLERRGWIDDADVGERALELLSGGQLPIEKTITFAGFLRKSPIFEALCDALEQGGVDIRFATGDVIRGSLVKRVFDEPGGELRAAGAWARDLLRSNPGASVAVIADNLDKDAETLVRQVRDSATPGWQVGDPAVRDMVNVSYGRALGSFPIIGTALLLLRWLLGDLRSSDISVLLRSPILDAGRLADRTRIEMRLREMPDRNWSPSMFASEFRRFDGEEEGDPELIASHWTKHLDTLSRQRRNVPASAPPSAWVESFDRTLSTFGWPGGDSLGSHDFQVVNRWRELLNEFARLALVRARMSAREALARLESMTRDVVFQPESGDAAIQLLGPLEAVGMSFDALWISGVTAGNWPPAGTPSRLLSRRLQLANAMPDSIPLDTAQFAGRVFASMTNSAAEVVCSYARHVDDEDQSASSLLRHLDLTEDAEGKDPGWAMKRFADHETRVVTAESAPAMAPDEDLSGGAATIQKQLDEPFSAFASGRLQIRPVAVQAVGIPPPLRGNIVHDALFSLYFDLPDRRQLQDWSKSAKDERIGKAVDTAILRHERNTDSVLRQLLKLENTRVRRILRQFVDLDARRDDFAVLSVEGKLDFCRGAVRLPLRFDRMDQLPDGGIAIIDYKTGSPKQLVDRRGTIKDIQLFVYAAACEPPASTLMLANIDSREISFSGAGLGFTDEPGWAAILDAANGQIADACRGLTEGDVRVNVQQGAQAARPHSLLSRFAELQRDIE